MVLNDLPTLEEIEATGATFNVRKFKEDHGGGQEVDVFDVIYFDGDSVVRYSDDVFDTEALAQDSVEYWKAQPEAPGHWERYTPRKEEK